MQACHADQFRAAGDKAMKRWSVFGPDFEVAAEEYGKAANVYKVNKHWEDAANMYMKVAELNEKLGKQYDVYQALANVATCQKHYGPHMDLVATLQKVVSLCIETARLDKAAKHQAEIATILENNHRMDDAIVAYRAAADLYQTQEHCTHSANQMLIGVANLTSLQGNYTEGAEIFERVAQQHLNKRMMPYYARTYLFQALLCYMALGDIVAVKIKFGMYRDIDPSFEHSREAKFVDTLINACERWSTQEFAQACRDYNMVSPLDSWKTSLLLVAKNRLAALINSDDDDEIDLS